MICLHPRLGEEEGDRGWGDRVRLVGRERG